MRLGAFITCIVLLILVCRFYSLPSSGLSEKEASNEIDVVRSATSDFSVVTAGYESPLPDSQVSVLTPVPVAASTLGPNAKNVQMLVRAQYVVPKSAAEILMKLESDVVVETIEIESSHQGHVVLQVTTDEATQESYSSFLSALFPEDAVTRSKGLVSVGESSQNSPHKEIGY